MIDSSSKKEIARNGAWGMDELQKYFEKVVHEAIEEGKPLTQKQIERLAAKTVKDAGRLSHRLLMDAAPPMLAHRRKEMLGFQARNFTRWRKAFDLMETIWVCCEELGSKFNENHRAEAVQSEDYIFEALTYLHAKALLVVSEIMCLLKGGFADGAMTRWRTLYETNIIGTLIRQEGQELAFRYVAHSRVQAWMRRQIDDDDDGADQDELERQAEYALTRFGETMKVRHGWACELVDSKRPTFRSIAKKAGYDPAGGVYEFASRHIHFDHRMYDDLLAVSESKSSVLLVGPSNSGMVTPLVVAANGITEATFILLSHKPTIDRLAILDSIWRMTKRMDRLAAGLERRTFQAELKRRSKVQ